jgi:hypothetical protein
MEDVYSVVHVGGMRNILKVFEFVIGCVSVLVVYLVPLLRRTDERDAHESVHVKPSDDTMNTEKNRPISPSVSGCTKHFPRDSTMATGGCPLNAAVVADLIPSLEPYNRTPLLVHAFQRDTARQAVN